MNKTLFATIGFLVLVGLGFGGMQLMRRSASAGEMNASSDTASVAAVAQAENIATTSSSIPQMGSYTMDDVHAHNTAASCWAVIRGSVYDLTSWIGQHPGGERAISQLCGTDGTAKFVGQHAGMQQQETMLATFKIGALAQ